VGGGEAMRPSQQSGTLKPTVMVNMELLCMRVWAGAGEVFIIPVSVVLYLIIGSPACDPGSRE
jgi:hypothetical protein